MNWVMFKVESKNKAKAEEIMKDELLSRQSIIQRDARSLNYEGDNLFIKIKGSKEAIKKAKELFKANQIGKEVYRKKAQLINERISAEESSAAEGMGLIFG
jgi:hypothetical protein